MEKYITPEVGSIKFTCPHCNAITQNKWGYFEFSYSNILYKTSGFKDISNGIAISLCTHCTKNTIWYLLAESDDIWANQIHTCIHPDTLSVPPINSEMPEEVKKLYQEAGSIFSKSPRASAALLRLAVQKLCIHLGESGTNINGDIKNLVQKGLPQPVQEALDVVRVTGNDAVHPGEIDTDDPETVKSLFELLNIIVEYMIAMPNKTSGLFNNLPQDKKDGITNRDK